MARKGKGDDDTRKITATRLRMARAAKRMNQTATAEAAQAVLSKLSPDDTLSREIVRKYEDDTRPYKLLSETPARAIALAEALDVEPTWLAPDLPLTPEGQAVLRRILADLVKEWPKPVEPKKRK